MVFGRMSGILLHPTSLPGAFGIGDLGSTAYQFVDFLVKSGQQVWQMLPLSPTGWGNSPYMSFSAMAGNPLLISPEMLMERGWLDPSDWQHHPAWPTIQAHFLGKVDFDSVIPFKQALLHRAWQRFGQQASPADQQAFQDFCQEQQAWLADYALFMTLSQQHQGQPWTQWDPDLAHRQPTALAQARHTYADLITEQQFWQFCFWQQWQALKTYAGEYGVKIVGDLPIYVAHNSADVWVHPDYFCLDATGEPELVAGVPPDFFSETGQRWGNPIYDWQKLKAHDYDWWIQRMQVILQTVDAVRIDHFRGFDSYWAIPAEEETAVKGEWLRGPGADFFQVLQQKLGTLPLIAEDLGEITPDVTALRDQFHLPGMKILEFAFGGGSDNPFLPHGFERNCVVYTGTHDNDTVVGWFYGERSSDWEQQAVKRYLGCTCQDGIHWDLIRLAMASVADLAIIPLQDVMGLGGDSRMNLPGTAEGNWAWRYTSDMLQEHLVEKLADMTLIYGRIPNSTLQERRHRLWQASQPPQPEEDSPTATDNSDQGNG